MRASLTKLLAMTLAALMLLSMVACGTTVDDPTDPAVTTQGAVEEDTEDMRYVCDLPTDLNYDGEEINIMYVKVAGRDDELISEELGHGTISDAVYERNVAVENQLGVKLAFVDQGGVTFSF